MSLISGWLELAGRDSSTIPQILRINADDQLQVDVVPTTKRAIEAAAVPSTEADVWTPGLAATAYLDVVFELVNIDGTNDATGVRLGIDYGNDGAASNAYFCFDITLTAGEVGTRLGPYRIWGDDAIRAEADAANDATLHVFIVEEGTAI